MDHPVKRFKPTTDAKPIHNQNSRMLRKDLYDGHLQYTTARTAAAAAAQAKSLAERKAIAAAAFSTTGDEDDATNAAGGADPTKSNIKSELQTGVGSSNSAGAAATDELDGTNALLQDIKTEPVDGDEAAAAAAAAKGQPPTGESLYTSKGLQPTDGDLDQLFDEDNLVGGSPTLGVSFYCFVYILISNMSDICCMFDAPF